MGAVKQDLEERTFNEADEIAKQRYGREFGDLPPSLQMQVWMEAEQKAAEYFRTQEDGLYERIREEGFNHRKDGDDHFAELELQRRLGK
ncbi:hypothetical protein ES707_13960 [subsurface metagenome]